MHHLYQHDINDEDSELRNSERSSLIPKNTQQMSDSGAYGSTSIVSVEKNREDVDRCTSAKVDGCWAWMVGISAFFIILFVDGISFTVGIFTEEWKVYFHSEENVAKVTVPSSVLQGMYLMAGPIASVLSIRLGARAVAVAGSILAAVGFLSASFVPNIELLIFTYGAITGLGFSFLFFTSMVTTTAYFERFRSLAVGLASCGSGVGIFIFPQIFRYVFDALSWQWCLRIQAGIVLCCFVLALTFRPIAGVQVDTHVQTTRAAFIKSFDVSLLSNPIFIILLVMACTSTVGILIPFNFIPLAAAERNMTLEESAWLSSILGASNTAGRALIGIVALKAPFHPLIFLIAAHTMGAIATFLSVFCGTFKLLAIYCGFFGFVFAVDAVLSTIILARVLGVDKLPGAFGLICMVRGITSVAVSPVSGELADFTGDYKATFHTAGAALALTAILSLAACILARRQSKNSYDIESPSTTDLTREIEYSDPSVIAVNRDQNREVVSPTHF